MGEGNGEGGVMQYETRIVDKERGIVQVTTTDERWYSKTNADKAIIWIPSVTWICGYYPKGIGYMKWLAAHGFDESIAIMEEAGERGTYTHKGSELLLKGGTLRFDTVVDDRPLSVDEYANVMSFAEWYNEHKPKVNKIEHTVFSPDDRYAGTIDIDCEIDGEPWIIDLKTSSQIWPSHEIQLSAYKHAHNPEARIGVVQLGYKYNKKKKWKFTEVEDQFDVFNAAYRIWQKECSNVKPLQRDYPLEITLNKEETNEAA
jgi:hypothetical protein